MAMLKHAAGVNTVLTKNTKRDEVCYRDTPPASLNFIHRIWGLTTDKTALAAHLGTNSITISRQGVLQSCKAPFVGGAL